MKLRCLSCVLLAVLLSNGLVDLEGADKKKRSLGIFEQATDVGRDLREGSSSYDPNKNQYTVTGGGRDIYFTDDDFHYLWRRVSGNWIRFTCTVEMPPEGDDPYPKAGLMFRESLDRNAPFVDVILHANGEVAMQYRRKQGEPTNQILPDIRGNRLMLEKIGNWLVLWIGIPDGGYVECGSIEYELPETLYAGLAVCAHNEDRLLTARFSDVTLASSIAE